MWSNEDALSINFMNDTCIQKLINFALRSSALADYIHQMTSYTS